MKVVTRFAPSPTGFLHVGNVRTAIITWLYAKKYDGQFILRMDDTDPLRSKDEYKEQIIEDLSWLGIKYDNYIEQSSRMDRYNKIKDELIASGRLYACYESQEELEMKKKLLISSGRPPIYDRAALKLTDSDIESFKNSGRTPHYRFRLNATPIVWNDMVKGEVNFDGSKLNDPILIREDGSMTYMLCSAIDDIDFNVSHIIRGEDHVSNTAVQIQIFEAIGAKLPAFGHLSLVKSSEAKISKRVGGFDVKHLRAQGFEPLTILSFLPTIGTSKPTRAFGNVDEIIADFDISCFSTSPTTYDYLELERINHKIVSNMQYDKKYFEQLGIHNISEYFWNTVKGNLTFLSDLKQWYIACYAPAFLEKSDKERDFLQTAAALLPEGHFNEETWPKWIGDIKSSTGLSGKELFMPLRLALTGMDHGPELKDILILIGREEIIKRLIQK